MTYHQMLTKHEATCQECKRVADGKSPLCSPRTVLEMMAKEEK